MAVSVVGVFWQIIWPSFVSVIIWREIFGIWRVLCHIISPTVHGCVECHGCQKKTDTTFICHIINLLMAQYRLVVDY